MWGRPGFDDFLRYCLIQHLLFIIAPIWNLDTPLYDACPNLYRWMLDLQNRDSNPFNLHGGHIYSHFMQAFGEKYKRIMPCRYFASHKLGLPRDLVMEPSGSSPRAPPSPLSVEYLAYLWSGYYHQLRAISR